MFNVRMVGTRNSNSTLFESKIYKHLRPVYKPHSVLRVAPHVRSSLWAARHRSAQCNLPGTGSLTV
jgi:hypothetical protein